MPVTVPGITFDEKGICSYCLSYQQEYSLGREALEDIIASSRNINNQYDCIVPLSGGRDSTFVLYAAKALYDLKVLAVSYDNEFRIEQALVNMQNACKILTCISRLLICFAYCSCGARKNADSCARFIWAGGQTMAKSLFAVRQRAGTCVLICPP